MSAAELGTVKAYFTYGAMFKRRVYGKSLSGGTDEQLAQENARSTC